MTRWEKLFFGCLAVAFIVFLEGCAVAKCALLDNTTHHCD